MKTIGIDFGASKLALACVNQQGEPEIIRNERGRATTPALLSFEGEIPVVGELAWEQGQAGKRGILSSLKHLIDHPDYLFSRGGITCTSIDLVALLLQYLKAQAEAYLKEPTRAAVIATPVSFTQSQCQALTEAAQQAGFEHIHLLREPLAAALTYQFFVQPQQRRRILIYDLGGGSFSVSLVELSAGDKRVIGCDGEARLGALDWHARLVAHVLQHLAHDGIELTEQELQGLDFALTWTRQGLSLLPQARFSKIFQGRPCELTLTQRDFAAMTQDLLETTGVITLRLLWACGIPWNDLDETLLIGGATRMPMVRALLIRLGSRQPFADFDPDTAIALGAALEGASLSSGARAGWTNQPLAHSHMGGVTTSSLGMIAVSADGARYVNSMLLPRNTPLPLTRTRSYTLQTHQQGEIQLEIILTRGEERDPCACAYLSRFLFAGRAPEGVSRVVLDVTCSCRAHGAPQIRVREQSSGQPLTLISETRPLILPDRFAGSPLTHDQQKAQTIYFAPDLSGSMTDPQPLFEEAKSSLLALLEQCDLTRHRVGLIPFSDDTEVALLATHEREALQSAIERLEIGQTGPGNNGQPFDELARVLTGVTGQRSVVLLTDGAWARPEAARVAAQRCRENGILIFAYPLSGSVDGAYSHFLESLVSLPQRPFITSMQALLETGSTIACEFDEDES